MGKPKKPTIGYHYLLSILSGICRGPIDELVTIRAGDVDVWQGNLYTNDVSFINMPDAFGGEAKEGGIQGPFALFMGAPDQVLPGDQESPGPGGLGVGKLPGADFNEKIIAKDGLPGVKAMVGGLVSEFRGVVTLWFDGLVTSMNPYPKEWKFRIRRQMAGWFGGECWYPSKAVIYLNKGRIHAMNGAHIVYECTTNPVWGNGEDASNLDENSFMEAANTLCDEGFGLCFMWYRKEDIDEFVKVVLDHIGGVLYTDRETGKIVLKLIRDDYVVADLPHFTPDSGLLDITQDDSESADGAYSEVVVTGMNPIRRGEDLQARAQNLAAWQSQGVARSLDKKYPGLSTTTLCARVAQRDLRTYASGLKKFDVTLDRRAWRLTPGSVIRISDPKRNISNIVLRISDIADGDMASGVIKVKAAQDVFGLPATTYVEEVPNTWVNPNNVLPLPAIGDQAFELSYRDAYLRMDEATVRSFDNDDGYLGVRAGSPSGSMYEYELFTRAGGASDFSSSGNFAFTGTALLAESITPLQTVFTLKMLDQFDIVEGEALQIDDETMRIDDWDSTTNTVTVARGAGDSIPKRHEANARVWLEDDDIGFDGIAYATNEAASVRVQTRSKIAILPEGRAPVRTIHFTGRLGRPYPPADVRVDGDSIYALAGVYPSPTISWVPRNRVSQEDKLFGHGEAGVEAEPGTTYTIRVYTDGVLRATYANIVENEFHYSTDLLLADGVTGTARLELVAVRDGIESNAYVNEILISVAAGYGFGYGINYGGQNI